MRVVLITRSRVWIGGWLIPSELCDGLGYVLKPALVPLLPARESMEADDHQSKLFFTCATVAIKSVHKEVARPLAFVSYVFVCACARVYQSSVSVCICIDGHSRLDMWSACCACTSLSKI